MWSVIIETIAILNASAVYLLFGFALAGVLHVLLRRTTRITDLLSRRGSKSVALAALFGAPLPLCSCSVIPAGLTLRKKGASKGATVSFLISVPETDVVSILLTYGLLGPVMAVFRPVAAVLTAFFTGHVTNLIDRWTEQHGPPTEEAEEHHEDEYDETKGPIWNALRYGFVTFFDDVIGSLLFGVVLGGLITALLPRMGLEQLAEGSFLAMLVMLVIGIPMYVCASSSTPIAAGLIAGGLSPGAALVFLLAGPATNMGSLIVLKRFLGGPVVAAYLACIGLVSVLSGLWLDAMMASRSFALPKIASVAGASSATVLQIMGAMVLVALAVASLRRTRALGRLGDRASSVTGIPFHSRGVKVAAAICALIAYLASGLFIVRPGQRAFVTRFGRITAANLEPGLHYRCPWPFGRADIESVAEIKWIELGFRRNNGQTAQPDVYGAGDPLRLESDMLTGNEDIVDIKWVVQYRIKDSEAGSGVYEYVYGIGDKERLVRGAAESAIREAVGGRDIDRLLTTERSLIESTVKDGLLQPILDRCASGIRVVNVSLLDVHAPPDVHWAFRDVASATEDKQTTINEAEEYKERVVREAKGEAAGRVASAEGRSVKIAAHATGEGTAFSEQLDAYRHIESITRQRLYFEALDGTLRHVNKYVNLSSETGGLDLWLVKEGKRTTVPPLPQIGGEYP